MACEEPLLEGDFLDGEQESEEGVVLDPEDLEGMVLCEVPDVAAAREHVRCDRFRGGVGEEVEDPVEHFNEEGEFGQDARMKVVGESGGVGRMYSGEAAAGAVFGREAGIAGGAEVVAEEG